MKKVFNTLGSSTLFFIIITVFIAASLWGIGTPKTVFYSPWFKALLGLLSCNIFFCLMNRFFPKRLLSTSVVLHASILVILSGTLVSSVWGERGSIQIREGETIDEFMIQGKPKELGFQLYLEDFILERYNTDLEKIEVYIEKTAQTASFPVEIGKSFQIPDSDYTLTIERYVPDFVMDINTKVVVSRTKYPNNPALKVTIKGLGQSRSEWLFSELPGVHAAKSNGVRLKYFWAPSKPKDYISKIQIIDKDGNVVKHDLKVNHPLRYKNYSFYQMSYDVERHVWSGVQVVNDNGVVVVYAGFILLWVTVWVPIYITPYMGVTKLS